MSEDSSDSVDECNQKFYNPLCLSGYLTPLQRKKLREKRKFQSDEIESLRKPVSVKKMRSIKRNKEYFKSVSSRASLDRKGSKMRIPQVQCTAAKIIFRTAQEDKKENKFFKTSSLNRLEKANFTMPLVLNKKAFLNIDNRVKQILSYPKKKSPRNENCVLKNNPKSSVVAKSPVAFTTCITPNDKQNFDENYGTGFQSEVSPVLENETTCNMKEQSTTILFEDVSISTEKGFVFDFNWNSDELPLKRKLNSLKESNDSVKGNDALNETQDSVQPMKYFPIFHAANKKEMKKVQQTKSNSKNVAKTKSNSSQNGEQMIIDAGQKEIGAKICSTCNMIYTPDQEEDVKLHSNFHNMYLINLKFPGWKEENMIGEYGDGRVIKITKEDKSFKLKKLKDILEIANRDLGFPSSAVPTNPDLIFVLFISNTKQVAGCVLAEPISSACQVLLANSESVEMKEFSRQKETPWSIGNWYSSSETVPAVCGINRVWVNHNFRRCKVASRMIDCLRCNFIHGHVVGIRELAFTDPTPDGREFAAAYTGTDNFLVYKLV